MTHQGFKCAACGGETCEPGEIHSKGWTSIVFIPRAASGWTRACRTGVDVKALACRACGLLQCFADPDLVDAMAGAGETRCRKCRYILRGLSQPRCPECGERI